MQPTIAVVDYDASWPLVFENLKSRVLRVLGDIATVEHVGSTSVPGLAAKPIVDMDVVVASAADVAIAIQRLGTLGYVHRGDLGIEGRKAFQVPAGWPAHHLYVCMRGGVALANHLAVRDYLRRNDEAAAGYGSLKKRLAQKHPADVDRYVDGKTDFLLDVLRKSGFPDEFLAAIGDANRIKR